MALAPCGLMDKACALSFPASLLRMAGAGGASRWRLLDGTEPSKTAEQAGKHKRTHTRKKEAARSQAKQLNKQENIREQTQERRGGTATKQISRKTWHGARQIGKKEGIGKRIWLLDWSQTNATRH